MPATKATSFFFSGGSTGCLLVHGYGGSPEEVRALGEHLALRGFTALGVCLAGHGGEPETFYQSRWPEWMASVEEGYTRLAQDCDRIIHVGFSLGGVLGLLLSQRRPLAGLITMGSRVYTTDSRRFYFAPLLRPLLTWRDPSLRALVELRKAVQTASHTLHQVRTPILVMHGRADTLVYPRNAEAIVGRVGSAEKELVWWEDTGHHLLVEGPHREKIYERVATFAETHAAAPASAHR